MHEADLIREYVRHGSMGRVVIVNAERIGFWRLLQVL
jgi:hypothetical protein